MSDSYSVVCQLREGQTRIVWFASDEKVLFRFDYLDPNDALERDSVFQAHALEPEQSILQALVLGERYYRFIFPSGQSPVTGSCEPAYAKYELCDCRNRPNLSLVKSSSQVKIVTCTFNSFSSSLSTIIFKGMVKERRATSPLFVTSLNPLSNKNNISTNRSVHRAILHSYFTGEFVNDVWKTSSTIARSIKITSYQIT
uniref:(California timema) hypothetical protein n=1 Tax=Timema californicum TaxID=61474 RepID=A0A7R9P563_TIMCA|nr:unnamed protein product [Timema californicum]